MKQKQSVELGIVPGEQIVNAISVSHHDVFGNPAHGVFLMKLLEEIAHPEVPRLSARIERHFGSWNITSDPLCIECAGSLVAGPFALDLNIIVGLEVGLVLRCAPGKSQSLKHRSEGANFVITLGRDIGASRLVHVANQIAAWVVHGEGWKNSHGCTFSAPFGDVGRPKSLPVGKVFPYVRRFHKHSSSRASRAYL